MRANVKPLTHWAIYKGYTLRFSRRDPHDVEGLAGAPGGSLPFHYAPETRTLTLAPGTPDARTVQLNEYGWEQAET
ncbi:MAG: hypothetical protein ACRC1H_15880 [Caldilineaceae bacterium]